MTKPSLTLLVALALLSVLIVPRAVLARTTPPATAAAHAPATLKPDAVKPDSAPDRANVGASAVDDDKQADADDDSADDAGHDNAIVSIGHDSTVAAGEHVSSVISVLGSSTSAGRVDEAVVSVLGNTRVTGPVGEAAVAVLGNIYVDSRVGEGVVAVLGNVELGPHADVGGDVVAVGGELKRDPGAMVHGHVQHVMFMGNLGGFAWLRPWVQHCLFYGRPLAFAPGLGWAWTVALSFLALYLLIALLFPKGVNQCVRTMESHPGQSVLAALFTFLIAPIVFLLLLITMVGAPLIPFLAFALFTAGIFGKAVALAWLGRRVMPAQPPGLDPLPVLAVLIGGLIALLLYVVPVLGFVALKAFDILGLGVVVYTLMLAFRASRAANGTPRPAPPPNMQSPSTPSAGATAEAVAASEPAASPAAATAAETPAPAAANGSGAATASVSAAHAQRAGFWIRMTALLLDLVLVAIIGATISISAHKVLLLLAAYGAVMWKLKGTTIGGTICGLRVVRLDGREIDWPTAIARALGCFLSMAVAGLGFIWVVFDPERQSWHDKIAGTVVIRAPPGIPLV